MTVYLDNSATTPVRAECAAVMNEILSGGYMNPSSTHVGGRSAKTALETARKNVSDAIGARPDEIFFTSGGTEADNWAVIRGAEKMRHTGKHIITSMAEHDAVLKCAEYLRDNGWDVTFLRPNSFGRITPEAVSEALRPDTALVSVMLVNNETGAVSDIAGISRVIKTAGSKALLHTDAVQAFCKIPVSAKTLGADMITLSAHKIHAVRGAGALYIRKGLALKPLLLGGGQEGGMRSGTEALANICAFGEAAKLGKLELSDTEKHLRALREYTLSRLKEEMPDTVFIGAGDAPHILSISVPGFRSEVLLNCLDSDGVSVSKSSACKRGGRSHVLEAMGLSARTIDSAIRVSFSHFNTEEEAEYFVSRLKAAAARLIRT